MRKKMFIPLLMWGVLFVSCSKEDKNLPSENGARKVMINFTTTAMSDMTTRSEGSVEENAIEKVAIFGINNQGQIEQTFPVIENPLTTGNVINIQNNVKMLKVIANPSSDINLNFSSLAEMESATFDCKTAPQSPYIMSGTSEVNSNSINIELVRNIAKIEVKGTNGFAVTSVTVKRTPSKSYVFERATLPSFDLSDYIDYPKKTGSIVYVAENSKKTPTELFVTGTYNGALTAYTITLSQNSQPIDILRNTSYIVSINPISSEDCSVDVTIPEWNEQVADDNFIPNFGTYYTADFHQHTAYSDGNNPITFVLNQGLKYALDFTINSEHGGAFNKNASEGDQETIATPCPTWIASGLTADKILGDVSGSGANQNMWRWQSIRDYSYKKVLEFNQRGATTTAIQGLEWNPPGHEHCSSGIITGQFDAVNPNASAMAQFEYMFDANDKDQTGGLAQGWIKPTTSNTHAKAMQAAAWMQANHRYRSWLVPAHPERQNKWQIEDYRDLNDIAPDVFVAFESIPGHQASAQRGGIGNSVSYKKSYTFGGVGIQAAKIGDLWDAMLSEGRRFWLVANSDFHAHVTRGDGDFYPGEYQKTYISMKEKTAQGFVDGLRAGNIFCVHGDLIDRLEFSVGSATMGQIYETNKSSVKVRILVRDPETNNNNQYSSLTNPALDHIDLIAGQMRPKVSPNSSEYKVNTYDKVKVVARFDATGGVVDANGVVSTKWIDLGGGIKLIEFNYNISGDTYFRLRGTNHGLNVAGMTDANGNPLEDQPMANVLEGANAAFNDLWFYSNPVFVKAN